MKFTRQQRNSDRSTSHHNTNNVHSDHFQLKLYCQHKRNYCALCLKLKLSEVEILRSSPKWLYKKTARSTVEQYMYFVASHFWWYIVLCALTCSEAADTGCIQASPTVTSAGPGASHVREQRGVWWVTSVTPPSYFHVFRVKSTAREVADPEEGSCFFNKAATWNVPVLSCWRLVLVSRPFNESLHLVLDLEEAFPGLWL